MPKTGWLTCKVHRGMFPDEVGVIVQSVEGLLLSFFIPYDQVRLTRALDPSRREEIDGTVSVQLFGENDQVRVVGLPREPFEGSRFVRVPRDLVVAQ